MIPDRPPGLLKRWSFPDNAGGIIVEERWDIETPGCPLIRNPWTVNPLEGRYVVRQVRMTESEYKQANIALFP